MEGEAQASAAPAPGAAAAPGDAATPAGEGEVVVVVGLGGVGSHCAHALLRAGVGRLRLVDFDRVSLSSLNRHAVAGRQDVGVSKVAACAAHFREIAPDAEVDARDEMFTAASADALLAPAPGGGPGAAVGMVIDCIDDVSTKADLLSSCAARRLRCLSALGSGAKSDPARLCVAKGLRDVEYDPLAAKLRKAFASRDVDLSDVSFLYSGQGPSRSLLPLTEDQSSRPEEFGNVANFRLRVVPVLGTQPALTGVALAGQALQELGLARPHVPRNLKPFRRALVQRWLEGLGRREASRSGGGRRFRVDVTAAEAAFLAHEVWGGRSALNREAAVSGASGVRFTFARWDRARPVAPDNVILATEDEAAAHFDPSEVDEATRGRVERALRGAPCDARGGVRAPCALEAGRRPLGPRPRPRGLRAAAAGAPAVGTAPAAAPPAGAPGMKVLESPEEGRAAEAALLDEQLSRSAAFLGPEGHARVRGSFVALAGLGAAGAAAAVLLARAGAGRLRLVDGGRVREEGGGAGGAGAQRSTVARLADEGWPKVEAVRRAIEAVLPASACEVEALARWLEDDAEVDRVLLAPAGQAAGQGDPAGAARARGPARRPDLVLECTRDPALKAAAARAAAARGLPVVAVSYCDGLSDPTRIAVAPLAELHADPGGAALRFGLLRPGAAGVAGSSAGAAGRGAPAEAETGEAPGDQALGAAFREVDVVHSQELGPWLEPPGAAAVGEYSPLTHCLGLAAAAVALHRLAGEPLPRPPPLPAACEGSWMRLRRGLVQVDPVAASSLDICTVGCAAEHVWRSRSALSGRGGAKLGDPASGLALSRWDLSMPCELGNLVLLTEEEAATHAAAVAATGSLPRPLLQALERTALPGVSGECTARACCSGGAPCEGQCCCEEDVLIEQQLRAHWSLVNLRRHLEGSRPCRSSPPTLAEETQLAPSRAPACASSSCRTRGLPCDVSWRTRRVLGAVALLATLLVARGRVRLLATLLVAWGRVRLPRHSWRLVRLTPSTRTLQTASRAPLSLSLVVGLAATLVAKVARRQVVDAPIEALSIGKRTSRSCHLDSSFGLGFTGLVGNTPLVELRSLSEALGCRVLAKAEFLNPGGCQKDRVAKQIIEEAERDGLLRPGSTVVEGTSGSTGISLCLVAAARGYRVHIVMPDDQAAEKEQLLRRFGAEVELVRPASIASADHYVNVARRRAEELNKTSPGAYFADQFECEANFNAHYYGTGPELWEQCGRRLDIFVMSAGTGGTLAGAGRFLKEVHPEVTVCLADVPGSSLYHKVVRGVLYAGEQSERSVRRHRTDTIAEGIGIDRLTGNFARGLPAHNGALPGVDSAVQVSDQEALDMAHYLLAHEGLFVGSSAAVNCAGAAKLARRLRPGSTVCTVLCDGGQRHVTRFYNPEVWEQFGLTAPRRRGRGDLSFLQ